MKGYAQPLFAAPTRIFRDRQSLSPNTDLPGAIKKSLEESEYLIYIAEAGAAQSEWCQKELAHWLTTLQREEQLIVIHSDDSIQIDPATKRINWDHTDAFPALFRTVQIKHLFDLSWVKGEAEILGQRDKISLLMKYVPFCTAEIVWG